MARVVHVSYLTSRSHYSLRRRVPACATRNEDLEPDWQKIFDSLDSDDLGLEGLFDERPNSAALQLKPVGSCYGCGVQLQFQDPAHPGFVDEGEYTKKQKHKQQHTILCARCQALTHGKMVPAVIDFSQQQERLLDRSSKSVDTSSSSRDEDSEEFIFKGEPLITPQQLREQLKVIRTSKSMCVMVMDILDTSGSFLSRIRSLIGSNPVIVVATKVDLLPKGTDTAQVWRWLEEFISFKKLNCLGVHLVSNKTGEGFDQACASILSQRLGRDVYIVGAANVGKSAFVRRMLKEMANMTSRHFDSRATQVGRRLPVESAMPGTTLGFVRLGAFSSGGTLYDTPGLHLHHRCLHILTPPELKAIHPKRKLRPYVAASPEVVAEQHASAEPSATYFWGAVLRIDLLEAPPDTMLVFFGTGAMQVYACRLVQDDEVLTIISDGSEDDSVFGSMSVAVRGGLRLAREIQLESAGFTTTLADVTISGMPGWVSVVSGGILGNVKLRVHAPRGVEVAVRPPLPCPTPVSADSML
eukprot:jgi/Ulvmu1/1839/UM119_0058.1